MSRLPSSSERNPLLVGSFQSAVSGLDQSDLAAEDAILEEDRDSMCSEDEKEEIKLGMGLRKGTDFKEREDIREEDEEAEDDQEDDDDQNYNYPEDNEDEETVFIEVAQLHTGKSFGELALITNKPRAARIKAITECHCAVMTKVEFDKSLAKIENKNRTKNIDFFASIPYFSTWSKTQLGKLIMSFNQTRCRKGFQVIRERQKNEDIYIVKSGEFLATRVVMLEKPTHDESVMQYLKGEKTKQNLRS